MLFNETAAEAEITTTGVVADSVRTASPHIRQVGATTEPDGDPLRTRRMSAARMLWLMRSLPVGSVDEEMVFGPILILSSRPGDETLGCGGLSAVAQASGRPVYILVLTDGSEPSSRAGYSGSGLRHLHESGCRRAAAAVGVPDANIRFLGLPGLEAAHRCETAGSLIQTVHAHGQACGAATLVATWRHDPNGDHLATSILGRRVAERMGLPLFEYPLSGWTLPTRRVLDAQVPNGFRLDIAAHLTGKRRAIGCHCPSLIEHLEDNANGPVTRSQSFGLFTGRYETFLRIPVNARPTPSG